MKKLAALALAGFLAATPVFAEFDDTDRAAVTSAFDTLIAEIDGRNYASIIEVMPPRILTSLAEQSGVDVETLKSAIVQQMGAVMDQAEIEEFTYDLDGATTGTSAEDRDYAIIPTRSVMLVSGQKMEAVGATLALEDEGRWYLVRMETPQHSAMIAELYPDLAELEYPEATMTAVE